MYTRLVQKGESEWAVVSNQQQTAAAQHTATANGAAIEGAPAAKPDAETQPQDTATLEQLVQQFRELTSADDAETLQGFLDAIRAFEQVS